MTYSLVILIVVHSSEFKVVVYHQWIGLHLVTDCLYLILMLCVVCGKQHNGHVKNGLTLLEDARQDGVCFCSVYLSIYLSIYLSVCLFYLYLSVYVQECIYVYVHVCMYTCSPITSSNLSISGILLESQRTVSNVCNGRRSFSLLSQFSY